MFLLSAAVVLCSALLQCFNQLVRHLANHQLCHRTTPKSTIDSNDSAPKNTRASSAGTQIANLTEVERKGLPAQGGRRSAFVMV